MVLEILNNMKTGEKIMVDGYDVVAGELKNGKRCFSVQHCCNQPRTAEKVLTLIDWHKNMCKKFAR